MCTPNDTLRRAAQLMWARHAHPKHKRGSGVDCDSIVRTLAAVSTHA